MTLLFYILITTAISSAVGLADTTAVAQKVKAKAGKPPVPAAVADAHVASATPPAPVAVSKSEKASTNATTVSKTSKEMSIVFDSAAEVAATSTHDSVTHGENGKSQMGISGQGTFSKDVGESREQDLAAENARLKAEIEDLKHKVEEKDEVEVRHDHRQHEEHKLNEELLEKKDTNELLEKEDTSYMPKKQHFTFDDDDDDAEGLESAALDELEALTIAAAMKRKHAPDARDCVWKGWRKVGDCSSKDCKCGCTGMQQWVRGKHPDAFGGKRCEGEDFEKKTCDMPACPPTPAPTPGPTPEASTTPNAAHIVDVNQLLLLLVTAVTMRS